MSNKQSNEPREYPVFCSCGKDTGRTTTMEGSTGLCQECYDRYMKKLEQLRKRLR